MHCTWSESRSPGHSLYVPGHYLHFKMCQVQVKESRALQDTLYTAQDVPGLNKQSRVQLNCTRSKSNSSRPMVPVTLVHYSMGNAILSHNSFSHFSCLRDNQNGSAKTTNFPHWPVSFNWSSQDWWMWWPNVVSMDWPSNPTIYVI